MRAGQPLRHSPILDGSGVDSTVLPVAGAYNISGEIDALVRGRCVFELGGEIADCELIYSS